ncbi:uncharacterized protein LOC122639794 [Telopea speciosissima]|uniref:uncharacterized protein LOC122639794 n=1 Tax=Telopea speciosissima TaxID=54955 RepID=UPI001CC66AE1|nr:uncharacterized protein LOC122639794 [Telopea speciosissima]
MEGVGARLGRSSTRYGGPTTVFSGPVRKWKKKWIHVSPSNTANHHSSQSNGANGSHLLLYKWTPLSQSNNNNGDKTTAKDDNAAAVALEEPPRKKFRYVPIAVLEEQNREAAEKVDEEGEPIETDPSAGAESKSDVSNEKPDINDVPMEEAQASEKDQSVPRELSETNLDLSLGLKGHDNDHDADPKREKSKDGQPE